MVEQSWKLNTYALIFDEENYEEEKDEDEEV